MSEKNLRDRADREIAARYQSNPTLGLRRLAVMVAAKWKFTVWRPEPDILGYFPGLSGFSFAEPIAARNRGTAKSRKVRTLSGSIPSPAWRMLTGIGLRSYCSRTIRNAPR